MEPRRAPTQPPDTDRPPQTAELPTTKAFVLQLTRGTGATLESFAGRLEHLASGRRLRFESVADFRDTVARLLAETSQR